MMRYFRWIYACLFESHTAACNLGFQYEHGCTCGLDERRKSPRRRGL